MKHFRIAILGDSPCEQCAGVNCCRQNGHEFAVLLEESERARFSPFAINVPILHAGERFVEKVLPYFGGKCQFLGNDNLCTIYDDRPANCRRFQCIDHYHNRGATSESHGRFLEHNSDVLARLEQL